MDLESIKDVRSELACYLEEVCNEKNYNLLILMVTDIIGEGTEVFFAGKDKWLLVKAFGGK
jgi:manganese-dependent inorganic pyrophosphatase